MIERRKQHLVLGGLLFALLVTSMALTWTATDSPPPQVAIEEPSNDRWHQLAEEAESEAALEGPADSVWTSDHPEHGGDGSSGPEGP